MADLIKIRMIEQHIFDDGSHLNFYEQEGIFILDKYNADGKKEHLGSSKNESAVKAKFEEAKEN